MGARRLPEPWASPTPSPAPPSRSASATRAGCPISHLDLYRLSGLGDEDPALLDDYLGPDRIAFLEWPEAARPRLERVTLHVRLEHRGGDRRSIAWS